MRSWTFAFVVCAATAIAAAPARAAPQLVHFDGFGKQSLQGFLFTPAAPGKHPAIVALHGCAGLTDKDGTLSARHADWGERWAAAGYIVIFPDSFASRGLGPQCKVSEREVKPSQERVADADSALRYLTDQRKDVDVSNVTLVGWSNGGSSTLYAVEPKNEMDGGPDFARAIAFYPGCRVPLESGKWSTRVPLTILIGQADDWTPAQPCVELGKAAKPDGPKVAVVTYPGAYHDFDHPDLPVHTIDGLAFTANGSGVAHTGTNPEARADAIKRVMALIGAPPKP